MGKQKNEIKDLLISLGISDSKSIVQYYNKVRDRDDISVQKCCRSGVILLSRSDHINKLYYSDKESFSYWGTTERKNAVMFGFEDNKRRYDQLKFLAANKRLIDIGTGAGGILDFLSPIADIIHAVEPQKSVREFLSSEGYTVFPTIEEAKDDYYEIVTLFHVFEHLIKPIETLRVIRKKMAKGAKIFIEIPHAEDFLISFLENEAFKKFTFWSEHLILHTRESIRIFLEEAGFTNIIINGLQRYPLANHLYWLAKGKPGGHLIWSELRDTNLDMEYSKMLSSINKTDTLMVTAEKR